MKALGQNIVFEEVIAPKKTSESKGGFEHTETDHKEMKYHKGKAIAVGDVAEPFLSEGSEFYYDHNRAYLTSIEGRLVHVTQLAHVIVVLDSPD